MTRHMACPEKGFCDTDKEQEEEEDEETQEEAEEDYGDDEKERHIPVTPRAKVTPQANGKVSISIGTRQNDALCTVRAQQSGLAQLTGACARHREMAMTTEYKRGSERIDLCMPLHHPNKPTNQ